MNLSTEDPDIFLAIELLSEWDGQLTKDSVAGSIYHVIRRQTLLNLLEPQLGPNVTLLAMGKGFHPIIRTASEFIGFDITSLFRMLDNESSWWIQSAGGKKHLMETSVKKGIQWLRKRFGDDVTEWRWERLHRIIWKHVLGSKQPLDILFNIGPIGHDGDLDTPKMSGIAPSTFDGFGWNPTLRLLVDFANINGTTFANSPGQSGQFGSKHFDDLVEPWLKGELHPMIHDRTKDSEHIIVLYQK